MLKMYFYAFKYDGNELILKLRTRHEVNTFLPVAGKFNDFSELFFLKIPRAVRPEVCTFSKNYEVRLLNCQPKGRKIFPIHVIRNNMTHSQI